MEYGTKFTIQEIMLMLGNDVVPPVITVAEARDLIGLPPIHLEPEVEVQILYTSKKILADNPPPPNEDTMDEWSEFIPPKSTSTRIWYSCNDGTHGWSIPQIYGED